MAKVGIIGSRKRVHFGVIAEFIDRLDANDVVVTGGAKGVDKFAEEYARKRGLAVELMLPEIENRGNRYEVIRAMHARNKKIIESVDRLLIFHNLTAAEVAPIAGDTQALAERVTGGTAHVLRTVLAPRYRGTPFPSEVLVIADFANDHAAT